jgi:CheY-like chemotaxis protein
VAGDGAQGVEMFRAWRPHLIWMDIRLPVMGGVEATAKIRELEGGREVKIVALSASVFAQEREPVLAAGLDDFMRKPYRREEIFDCLARHLGVRYAYGETEQPPRPVDAGPVQAADLAKLPGQLQKELLDAVVRLDSRRIRDVINRVAEHDDQLGQALSRAAQRLAYTEILDALGQSNART